MSFASNGHHDIMDEGGGTFALGVVPAPHRLLKQEGTEVDGFAFYFIPEYYLTLLLIFVEIKKEPSLTVVCVDNERFFHGDYC